MSCKSFVVDRAKWSRGSDSMLLNRFDGKMCCLGFAALACGYSKDEILDQGCPEELVLELNENGEDNPNRWFNGLIKESSYSSKKDFYITKICTKIIRTNDSKYMTDCDREAILTELFAKLGIQVKFKGVK